jgi:hypothetical protein
MLKLVNGKFYRDGVEVKPEIGNPEMIKLLQRENDKKAKQNAKGIEGKFRSEDITYYTHHVNFTCECGTFNDIDLDNGDFEEWESHPRDYDDVQIECERCENVYEIVSQNDWKKVKLIKVAN